MSQQRMSLDAPIRSLLNAAIIDGKAQMIEIEEKPLANTPPALVIAVVGEDVKRLRRMVVSELMLKPVMGNGNGGK